MTSANPCFLTIAEAAALIAAKPEEWLVADAP